MTEEAALRGLEVLRAAVAPDRFGFLSPEELEALASDPATAGELILFRCGGFRCLVPAKSVPAFVACIEGGARVEVTYESEPSIGTKRLVWVRAGRQIGVMVPAEQVEGFRRAIEDGGDYIRDASLPADRLDKLRREFAMGAR